MNMVQWGSLLVVVLMVASILGYSLIGSKGTTPTEDVPPPEQPPVEIPELLFFQSKYVDANVVEVFSSLTVIASTKETEISLIDAQLYQIEGVRKVSSFYSEKGQTEITVGLSYTANLVFEPGTDKAKLIADIREKVTKLENPAFYSNGLIRIPQDISLSNDDKNVVKQHHFDEPFIQAILSSETFKGDEIGVQIQAGFRGDVPSNVIAFEVNNYSDKSKSISLAGEQTLSSLDPAMRLNIKTTAGDDLNSFEEELKGLAEVSEVNLAVDYSAKPGLKLAMEEIDENTWAELESLLAGVKGASPFFSPSQYSDENKTYATVYFDGKSDYADFKAGIQTILQEQGLEAELTDPEAMLIADLNTASTEVKALSEELAALLKGKGYSEFKIFQKGEVTLAMENLVDEESGESFSLPEDLRAAKAWLLPGHQAGETISFEIFALAKRGQVEEVELLEKTEE